MALGGVPVLVDAGRPTYTAATFGPDRYTIWTMQSSWHNVPEIRGTAQAPGRIHAARDVSAVVEDGQSGLTLDLAGAYPRTDIRHWRRTARLDRESGRVIVTDDWEFTADGDAATSVHLLVAGDLRVGSGRAEITALEGAGDVLLTWQPADGTATATATIAPALGGGHWQQNFPFAIRGTVHVVDGKAVLSITR